MLRWVTPNRGFKSHLHRIRSERPHEASRLAGPLAEVREPRPGEAGVAITAVSIGRKHEKWVSDGIERYTQRLRKPYDLTWKLLPHSAREHDVARDEESARILSGLKPADFVILLDERGTNVSSPMLAKKLQAQFDAGRGVVVIIGGAYGVNTELSRRADFVWSMSKLVFPHQLVRLILAEQIYRAQEISGGRPYHHQ